MLRRKSVWLVSMAVAFAMALCWSAVAFADEFAVGAQSTSSALSAQAGDALGSATPISLNRETRGALDDSSDEDWYKVTLPQAGKFQLAFGGDYNSDGGSWRVTLKDASNAEVWERSHRADSLTTETFGVTGLPAGSYYLVVSGYYDNHRLVDLTYSVTPQFEASSAWETEFNDGLQSADVIALGAATSGTIRESGDVDWYKVTLPSAGKFEVTFGGEYSADGGSWDVALKDADNAGIWERSHSSRSLTTETFGVTGLPAGSYYLVVNRRSYSDSVTDLTYSVTPQFEASSAWETEFNDLITTANPVAMNATVHGTTRSGSDEDWFRIDVPKRGMFQIRFNATYTTDYDYWRISLRDWRNNELQYYDYSASTKKAKSFVTSSPLDPGVYYIKVSGGPEDLEYNVTPGYYVPSTKLAKVAAKRGAFKARWVKKAGATSYQIRYSTKANMAKAKTVDASRKSKTKTVGGLKSKKRYYVQVRVGRTVDDVTYYSSWSNKKSVRTR